MKSIEKCAREETFVERRSYRRCSPEIDAFVSFTNCGVPSMCQLLDISLGGLAFGCTPYGRLFPDLSKLSIVIPKPVFYLQNISFGLISDCEIDIGSTTGFASRRYGIEFTDLKPSQNASLNCLIETLLGLPWGFSFAGQNIIFQKEGSCSSALVFGHGA